MPVLLQRKAPQALHFQRQSQTCSSHGIYGFRRAQMGWGPLRVLSDLTSGKLDKGGAVPILHERKPKLKFTQPGRTQAQVFLTVKSPLGSISQRTKPRGPCLRLMSCPRRNMAQSLYICHRGFAKGSMKGSQAPRLLSARAQRDPTGLPTQFTARDSPRFSSACGPHFLKDFIKGMALVRSHFVILSFREGR